MSCVLCNPAAGGGGPGPFYWKYALGRHSLAVHENQAGPAHGKPGSWELGEKERAWMAARQRKLKAPCPAPPHFLPPLLCPPAPALNGPALPQQSPASNGPVLQQQSPALNGPALQLHSPALPCPALHQ